MASEHDDSGKIASMFDLAVATVAGFVEECMTREAIDDILIVAVSQHGAMQFIGTGKVFPTNEEVIVSHDSILIFRNDLLAALKIDDDEAGQSDES